jgi:hypothetical protein
LPQQLSDPCCQKSQCSKDARHIGPTSTIVMFYSGASHSFISAAYVEKHILPMSLLKCQMIVRSPRGDMSTMQL